MKKRPHPSFLRAFGEENDKWKQICQLNIAICGLSSVGALAAEALTRSGVGKLLLIDNGRVKMASILRMFFRPQEIGLSKIQATRLRLGSISPILEVDSLSADLLHRECE
jgi:ubiquitin-like modifier-activating enzyme 5